MSRLSEAQQQTVLRLAQPLQRHQRGDYFRQIGIVIAGMPTIGDGELYRLCVQLQRQMLSSPSLALGWHISIESRAVVILYSLL